MKDPTDSINSISFFDNGEQLVSGIVLANPGNASGKLVLWNVRTGLKRFEYSGHMDAIGKYTFFNLEFPTLTARVDWPLVAMTAPLVYGN